MLPKEDACQPRAVAVLGATTWDEFLVLDREPEPDSWATIVEYHTAGGGSAANLAVALQRLGVSSLLVTKVGDDPEGSRLVEELRAEGVTLALAPSPSQAKTDRCVILVTPGLQRTILWMPGARLRLGDPLPLQEVLSCHVVVLDLDDPALLRFVLDLPTHTAPRIRLVGYVKHLARMERRQALDFACRFDVLIGSESEFSSLLGRTSLEEALDELRSLMRQGVTRLVAVTRGVRGSWLVTLQEVIVQPAYRIRAIDPTGAGDAFAAGIVYGIVRRLPLTATARIASAMGALATRSVGARTALPTLLEVEAFLREAQPCD